MIKIDKLTEVLVKKNSVESGSIKKIIEFLKHCSSLVIYSSIYIRSSVLWYFNTKL